jgi:uncharacterized repeat protein (TIGR03806 family)
MDLSSQLCLNINPNLNQIPRQVKSPLSKFIASLCLGLAAAGAAAAPDAPPDSSPAAAPTRVPVLTFHYDNTRQGANTNETLLTPANVNGARFGKLFTHAVDGYVSAQPLIMTNLDIPGQGIRNVVFVVTEHNSVYAFDADSDRDAARGLLWTANVGIAARSPSPEYGARYHPQGNTDLTPEEGIMGTPVIDPAGGTIYLDAFTREVVAGVSTNYSHRIHALNITNGNERPFSPVTVAAAAPGTGVAGDGTTVRFSAVQHLQRPALTLAGGILYVCYGSHADTDPYHGWILGYNPANLALLTNYVFNTTPNATAADFGSHAGEGALWMGGNGLCVDAGTNLYFETANGSFSQKTNGGDYGDCFVRLSTSNGLAVADYFTPFNEAALQASDSDLGSGGPVLLPETAGGAAHPRLIVGAGKEGKIYLVDCDNMGRFQSGSDSQIVQSIPNAIGGGGSYATPAYFNNRIYYTGKTDVVRAFLITNGMILRTPESRSTTPIGAFTGSPVVSANGIRDAIVWVIDPGAYARSGPAVLHAYNATNLALELYNSSQNADRDNPGGAVKMTTPVVAGGKVYVGAQYALSVFGLANFLPAPAISPPGGDFTNSVPVTLAGEPPGVSIHFTLDGTKPDANSALYTGPIILTRNTRLQAVAVAPDAPDSGVALASFVNTAAPGSGSGLTGAYFANHTSASPFTGPPDLVQTNATINFNWAESGPAPLASAANFTVRWTGTLQPQFNETYSFQTTPGAAARLWLNGRLLIDDWPDTTAGTTNRPSMALDAQQLYNVQLDYCRQPGQPAIALSWSSPSTPLVIVPRTQLYPFTNPPPAVVLTAPAGNAAEFSADASVTLNAGVTAPYNPISRVEFFANGSLLGRVTNQPFTLTATGLRAGNYALSAVAVDGSGLSGVSRSVNITVANGGGRPYGLTNRETVPPYFNMPPAFNGAIPPLLSRTGVFSDTPRMIPARGLIPYVPNTPLWSDDALKTRYLAVPRDGGPATPSQQITFTAAGPWTFPAGTVFVKTFELNPVAARPEIRHRLETRLLVRDSQGAVYGVTYKWRADNSDADLLAGSLSENILITNAAGTAAQTWYYPSPADCLACHTAAANYVLGVNTRQLNAGLDYPDGVTDNQLRALNRIGLFNPAFDERALAQFEKLSALTNSGASLQERVRSYLDANCAQCHLTGGTGVTFDARYDEPPSRTAFINSAAQNNLGFDNVKLIAPKDIWRSMIYRRMNTTNPIYKMPPLARALIDTNAVALLGLWINSLPGVPALAPPSIVPNGGAFPSNVSVTLHSPDPGAVLYYTLDGTLPGANSLRYTGAFSLATNATISATAVEAGFTPSVAATALFLIPRR